MYMCVHVGDTYFDKAVDGFLKDLFSIWKVKQLIV